MDAKLALHTACRRYLMERAEILDYPLRGVLDGILEEVESLRPEDFLSLSQLTAVVHLAADVALCHTGLDERSNASERARFQAQVGNLSAAELAAVRLLPAHRVLAPSEVSAIWEQLRGRWDAHRDKYWYSLRGKTPPGILDFNLSAFTANVSDANFYKILQKHHVATVIELREHGPCYELDPSLVNLVRSECFWTAAGFDWLVYLSHKASITVAGDWLVAEIQAAWPAYAAAKW